MRGKLKSCNHICLCRQGQIGRRDMFMGYGYGGQVLIVFPEEELIVVTTAHNQVDGDTSTQQELALFNIVASYIVPALNEWKKYFILSILTVQDNIHRRVP